MPSTSVPLSVNNYRPRGGVPEVFLRPDRFFYAEWGGGWQTPFVDGQARLNDIDVDDQGYLYLSHYVFGAPTRRHVRRLLTSARSTRLLTTDHPPLTRSLMP